MGNTRVSSTGAIGVALRRSRLAAPDSEGGKRNVPNLPPEISHAVSKRPDFSRFTELDIEILVSSHVGTRLIYGRIKEYEET